MSIRQYTLKGKTPVECPDLMQFGEWFESADRIVKQTMIGDVKISTVFLGLDHSFTTDGPPLLFETMIFGGVYDEYQYRYSTWDEAEAGHTQTVLMVVENEPAPQCRSTY